MNFKYILSTTRIYYILIMNSYYQFFVIMTDVEVYLRSMPLKENKKVLSVTNLTLSDLIKTSMYIIHMLEGKNATLYVYECRNFIST